MRLTESNQTMGALEADILQFASAGQCIDSYGLWIRKLKKYAAATSVEAALKKTHWMKPCSDLTELKKVYDGWDKKKSDKFQIHYGCSVNSLFNFESVYGAVRRLHITDPNVRFLITTPSMAAVGCDGLDKEWLEVHIKCPRREFYQHALKSHVFVIWFNGPHGINHGSTIEMARLGVVPVFQQSAIPYPWTEKYPYTFTNGVQLIALLKWLKEHYNDSEVQCTIESNIEMLDSLYNGECSYDYKIDYIEKLHRERVQAGANCMVKDLMGKLPDKISMDELVAFIKEKTDVHVDYYHIPGAKAYFVGTKDQVRTYMMFLGYKDVGTPESVVFERVHAS